MMCSLKELLKACRGVQSWRTLLAAPFREAGQLPGSCRQAQPGELAVSPPMVPRLQQASMTAPL